MKQAVFNRTSSMKHLGILILLSTMVLSACSTSRKTTVEPLDDIRDLSELVVMADAFDGGEEVPTYPYRATPTRHFDLLHTDLDLSFDWEKQHVLGKATLRMTPLAYPQDSIILDAVGFIVHDIRLKGSRDTLAYYNSGWHLRIALPRPSTKKDTLDIVISYTARPEEKPIGGSAAIRSDKGLYFINPTGQYRDKPTQVWTQGETQSNSRWFPTFDQPNERTTQQIRITVDSVFETLSNGLLIKQEQHPDGTRSDTWRMDLPHAPYLFMLAIGDYSVTSETWRGIPFEYYVEKDFAEHAKAIFPDAPAMMSFFADYVGVPYPWPKYSQVVVRDYVSGAMENTTAVVYGEFMQATQRELIDERRNEVIGAHELIHHWFGDLLTCESWSNLVLNEGFANYGEYLWLEFKYGKDEAEFHRRDELIGYLQETSHKRHPLVDYHYANKDDMFDAHSYNKGGLVLHMLRQYLGEATFRAGIKRYLLQHAYEAVEVHDLRIAMEDVSGQDLNWFFEQWFYQPGHPQLSWEWSYDNEHKALTVEIAQVQDPTTNGEVYDLPTEIAVMYARDKVERYPLRIQEAVQTFTFLLDEMPLLVDFDPDRVLIVEANQDWSSTQAAAYWRTSPSLWSRLDILEILEDESSGLNPFPYNDPHWSIRAMSTATLDASDPVQQLTLAQMVREDVHSAVRESALSALNGSGFPGLRKLCLERLETDQAYGVLQAAITGLQEEHALQAMEAVQILEKDPSVTATLITGDYYGRIAAVEKIPFFYQSWERINGMARMLFTKQFVDLLHHSDDAAIHLGIDRLRQDATDMGWSPVRRFSAFRALALLRQHVLTDKPALAEEIMQHIGQIRDAETDEDLLRYYQSY